jgi:hypothetical protein
LGTEESVPFLIDGDYCLDRQGLVGKVVFRQKWDGGVYVRILSLSNHFTTRDIEHLTRVDPAFYKLFGIEET